MKKFREFKSQQQVVNEIGPVGATIATAIGIGTGAAWSGSVMSTVPCRSRPLENEVGDDI